MREPFGRLDADSELRKRVLPLCRLGFGEVWQDAERGHRVGVIDATSGDQVASIVNDERIDLVANDPPYNIVLAKQDSEDLGAKDLASYMDFSEKWVKVASRHLASDAHFYVWLGADMNHSFQPLPDFMLMMRSRTMLQARNYITVRNQRGYGTQRNWMWVRQELLHYTKGNPPFTVVYTDIPRVLRGYYKEVGGSRTENMERSRSTNIRPGNVWVDIQQVFYRLEENVPGAYAQKPLKAMERILSSSSCEQAVVMDCFSHAGTTLLAGERLGRKVVTFDIDPIFAELSIRRLEHYRRTGRTGWQCENPFPEVDFSDLNRDSSRGRSAPEP